MTQPAHFFKNKGGRTQSQVDTMQQKLQDDAESKEKYVEVEAIGDVTIDPTMMVALSGTQTAWDQSYYIESVTHDFSVDHGYTMEITAKNGSPEDANYLPGSGDTGTSGTNPESFPSDPGFSGNEEGPAP